MRAIVLLSAVLVLAMGPVYGQIATGIHLVDVRFKGDMRLETVDLRKCAADLKSRIYQGPEWLSGITERVRVLCLQDHGYFRAAVKPSSQQLPDKHETHQFVVTFEIDAGPQYRTEELHFRNNRLFSAEELRSMFKVASDSIFSPAQVRHGLDQMRTAYAQRHYLNFVAVPDASIDEVRHIVNLFIYCDEGKQSP